MANPRTRRKLIQAAVGAVVGLGIGYGAGEIGLVDWLKVMPGEDIASTAVAAILLLLGLFSIVAASNGAFYRRMAASYEPGDPVDSGVLRYLRLSGVILLLSAILLMAPPLAVRFGLAGDAAIAVAVGIGLLLAVQTWLNARILRRGDELLRATTADASAASFWLLQLGLFGWAALAKLGLVATVSMWSLMTIAMVVYLVVSIVAAIRRGMFA